MKTCGINKAKMRGHGVEIGDVPKTENRTNRRHVYLDTPVHASINQNHNPVALAELVRNYFVYNDVDARVMYEQYSADYPAPNCPWSGLPMVSDCLQYVIIFLFTSLCFVENQDDYVDLLQIRGYIRTVKNKKANRKIKQKLRTFR
jgi:hypothetical protein